MSFWVVMILAGVVAGLAGLIIGWPTLRLRGDYLAIVTLGFGEIIPDIFRNGDQMPLPEGVRGSLPFVEFGAHNLTNESVESRSSIALGSERRWITRRGALDRYSSLPTELKPWFYTILIMT